LEPLRFTGQAGTANQSDTWKSGEIFDCPCA